MATFDLTLDDDNNDVESSAADLLCFKEASVTRVVLNQNNNSTAPIIIVPVRHGVACSSSEKRSDVIGPEEIYWHILATNNEEDDVVEVRTHPPNLLYPRLSEQDELFFSLRNNVELQEEFMNPLMRPDSMNVAVHITVPLHRLSEVLIPGQSLYRDSCQITVDPPAVLNSTTTEEEQSIIPKPLYIRNEGRFTNVHVQAPTLPVHYSCVGDNTVAEIRSGAGSLFEISSGVGNLLVIDSTSNVSLQIDESMSARVMIKGNWSALDLSRNALRSLIWYHPESSGPINDEGVDNDIRIAQAIDEQAFDFSPLHCMVDTDVEWQELCPEPRISNGRRNNNGVKGIAVIIIVLVMGYVLWRWRCRCCCCAKKPKDDSHDQTEISRNHLESDGIGAPPASMMQQPQLNSSFLPSTHVVAAPVVVPAAAVVETDVEMNSHVRSERITMVPAIAIPDPSARMHHSTTLSPTMDDATIVEVDPTIMTTDVVAMASAHLLGPETPTK